MAERNAVIERVCTGCDGVFRCTAQELRQRIESCYGARGRIWLPDCYVSTNVREVIQGER